MLKKFQLFVLSVSLVILISGMGLFFFGHLIFPSAVVQVISFSPPAGLEYKVLYTKDGYEPNLLEVPVGSRVEFKNVSDIPMWTASDPHPIHSDFAEFDARHDYDSGESYVFQFIKPGTFGFHNHEKSIDRGIVRVIDYKNPLPNIDKTKEGQRAVRDKFLAMFNQKDPDSVFKLIDAIEANNALSRDCHDMSHDLGHRAYELFGFSSAMTFSNPNRLSHTSVDDICAGGYIHGILEELFLHRPELKSQPETICSSIPDNNRGSCFHGVGHGLMFVNKRDVPVSLNACRSLGGADVYRCFEGVWMEMFWGTTDHAGADSLGWTLEKPLTACVNAQEDEKPTCFLYAHLGYLRTHPKDFTGAVDLCVNSGLVESDVLFCLKGVGITMMKHFTSHNLGSSEKLVEGFTPQRKYAYYAGVIGYSRLSGVSETDLKSFCKVLKTDTQVCLTVMKNEPR